MPKTSSTAALVWDSTRAGAGDAIRRFPGTNVSTHPIRRELPALQLLVARDRPESVRWLGERDESGGLLQGVSYAEPNGAVYELWMDAATKRLTHLEWVRDDPVDGLHVLVAERQGYADLLAALGEPPTRVVHLWNVTGESPADDVEQHVGTAFWSLLWLGQALGKMAAQAGGPVSLVAVSDRALRVSGEAAPHPGKATMIGPVEVLPREHPEVRTVAVDLGDGRPGGGLDELVDAFDFEAVCYRNISFERYDYMAHGDGSEWNLRRNRQAFDWVDIVQGKAVDPASVDMSSVILGVPMKFPIFTAPSSGQGALHPDGEIGMYRGATAADTLASFASGTSVPDTSRTGPATKALATASPSSRATVRSHRSTWTWRAITPARRRSSSRRRRCSRTCSSATSSSTARKVAQTPWSSQPGRS